MTRHLSFEELLQIAESLPGDPECRDLGAVEVAALRTRAHRMRTDVYASDSLKAGALLQTLALLAPLESQNLRFAWAAAQTFLSLNGHRLDAKPADVAELMTATERQEIGVLEIGARLRSWIRTT